MPAGEAYIASKTYYFGVGGGTRDFIRMVESDNHFAVDVIAQIGTGVKREILKLTPL